MEVAEITASNIVKKFGNIIDLLRYHVAAGRFGYIDRICAAMDPKVVEETLREAMRAVIGSEPIVINGRRLQFKEGKAELEEKISQVTCCETEELKERDVMGGKIPGRIWLHGTILRTEEGRFLACYTPPKTPSDAEVSEFVDIVNSGDLSVARRVAYLALFKPGRKEE